MARFLILLSLLIAVNTYGQRYNFTNYTLGEGFQNSQITDIIQDHQGILWISTLSGVVTFDGIRFTDVSREIGFENSPVKCLFQDSKGNYWVSVLRKGVYKYNGKERILYTTKEGLLSNIINTICEDDEGAIWIGTNLGLNRILNDKIDSYTIDNGLVNNNIFKLFKGKNKLWIGTVNGICYFDKTEFKKVENGNIRLGNQLVYSLYEDQKENLWIGTIAGLILYQPAIGLSRIEHPAFDNSRITGILKDSKGKIWFATHGQGAYAYDGNIFRHYSETNGLSSNIILALINDNEGNIWFGTASGLSRFSGEMFVTYSREYDLANDNILSTCTDKNGYIWFGSVGRGLIRYDGNSFTKYGPAEGMFNNTIWTIYQDKEKLYIGTNEGIAFYDEKKNKFTWPDRNLKNNTVYAIISDKDGKLWLGTDRGIYVVENKKISQYNRFKGLANENVRVLYEDREGLIWIGTLGGIFYWDGDTINDFSKQHRLGKRTVTSIIEDKNNNIIFGIYDEGIKVFDKSEGTDQKDKLHSINSKSGLQGEKVLSLYLDGKENLWVGTSNGIESIRWADYLKNDQLIIKKYNSSDGYLGMECNSISEDINGNLWFGTVNGIVEFRPEEKINDRAKPKPRILSVLLFNEPVDWSEASDDEIENNSIPQQASFNHDENFISFEYSATFLSAPEYLEFQYKLEGYDKDWSQVTRSRSVYYADLLPGQYIFKVRAAEKGENWSDPATFSFSIAPPFWLTPFAYLIYGAILIASIFLVISLRTRSLRVSKKTLSKKVEERTRELQEKTAELERLSIVAKETGNAVMIFNAQKKLEWLNEGFTTLTGYTKSELESLYGDTLEELCFNPEAKKKIEESVQKRKSTIYEGQLMTKDNKQLWISTTLTPIYNGETKLKNVVLIHSDITYRKEMEENIKDSLDEKQKLLREIHHRVKNNLQIIISLLNLQSSYISDDEALKALKEGQDRVKSLALIHEKIYQSDELSDIEFKEYIKKLLEHLYFSYNINKDHIKINVYADNVYLDIDTAVPCGLIINELVTNALKYAFHGRDEGVIDIRLETLKDCYKLSVKDDGVGMPENFDIYSSETLGMQLLTALVDQLEGKIELVNSNGVNFTIYFKKPGNH